MVWAVLYRLYVCLTMIQNIEADTSRVADQAVQEAGGRKSIKGAVARPGQQSLMGEKPEIV